MHARSTSVGDVLEVSTERLNEVERSRSDGQGNLFVVESGPYMGLGFRAYRPRAIRPYHRLAEAYRLLDESLALAGTAQLTVTAGQARDAMLYVLEAEGYPRGEVPVLDWDKAQSGDLVGDPDTGLFRVIARKLHPKWRAKRLLMHIPNAQIWIDSPRIPRQARDRLWAVLVPVNEAKSP